MDTQDDNIIHDVKLLKKTILIKNRCIERIEFRIEFTKSLLEDVNNFTTEDPDRNIKIADEIKIQSQNHNKYIENDLTSLLELKDQAILQITKENIQDSYNLVKSFINEPHAGN